MVSIPRLAIALLSFFLDVSLSRAQSTNSPIHWGSDTNALRAGFCLRPIADKANVEIISELDDLSDSNGNFRPDWLHLWLPPLNSRYQINLFDASGRAVPKTTAGMALGSPVLPKRHAVDQTHGYIGADLVDRKPQPIYQQPPLLLGDFFKITNSGPYRLELRIAVV